MTIPRITPRELMDRYAVLLLDAYGVLVSLDGALPGAREFIAELNRRRKPYWLLSNTAARLPEHAAERYRGFGLTIPPERILTSGLLLGPYLKTAGLSGQRCLVLGPEDSVGYVETGGGLPVGFGEEFDVLVLADQSGYPLLETLDWLLSRLIEKLDAGRTVPMILPNPDLFYPKAVGYGITSGSLAVLLEAALRQRYPLRRDVGFVRLGKPHPALFQEAERRSACRDMVMVGDQLETDILGAQAFGIDSALVLGGVAGGRDGLPEGPIKPSWLLAPLQD
jgi:HAD superfamily hydrolase (TIGR01450 family)